MKKLRILAAAMLAVSCARTPAADRWSGYLCCNMRTDGSRITDINYDESGKHLVPAGSRIAVTGYGHHRVKVTLENRSQIISNDYSRDLSMEVFAKRYVVADDPNVEIGSYPPKVQNAIHQAHVMIGMSREQVLMALGYPVSSENPNLADKTWNYWLFTWLAFKVRFDDAGRLVGVDADSQTKERVLAD
jgi:hypothetical protein